MSHFINECDKRFRDYSRSATRTNQIQKICRKKSGRIIARTEVEAVVKLLRMRALCVINIGTEIALIGDNITNTKLNFFLYFEITR